MEDDGGIVTGDRERLEKEDAVQRRQGFVIIVPQYYSRCNGERKQVDIEEGRWRTTVE